MVVLDKGYIWELYNTSLISVEKGNFIYDVIDFNEDELLMKAGLGQ